MKSLSINGHKLHAVEMLLVPYSTDSVSYLKYPKHRIQYEIIDDNLTLKIPSMLALELYRKGIIPQDERREIVIRISKKKIGNYLILDFLYPNDHSEIVTILLKKVNGN